jgi:hypothetical protein
MVVFAGIKVDLDALVEQEHTTFLRRSRELDFRRLTPSQTRHVLSESIRIGGKTIDPDALTLLVTVSQGYPYLVQLAGDYAWRSSGTAATITLNDAHAALSRRSNDASSAACTRTSPRRIRSSSPRWLSMRNAARSPTSSNGWECVGSVRAGLQKAPHREWLRPS